MAGRYRKRASPHYNFNEGLPNRLENEGNLEGSSGAKQIVGQKNTPELSKYSTISYIPGVKSYVQLKIKLSI